MPIVAQIAVAAVGAVAANSAAKKKAKSAREAQGIKADAYEQAREDVAPWYETGKNAIQKLDKIFSGDSADYSDYYKSPGYDFTLSEGMKGIENRASVGSLLSGRTLKGLNRFGQDNANKYYQNYVNDLKSLAGSGQQAGSLMATLGVQSASDQAKSAQEAGNARAAGYLGIGNAISQGIGGMSYFSGLGGTQNMMSGATVNPSYSGYTDNASGNLSNFYNAAPTRGYV